MERHAAWRHLLAGFAFGLMLGGALPAAAMHPLMTRIRPEIDVYPQFFALTQGRDRTLYVGAIDKLLRFDGARWSAIVVPSGGPVRTLHTDRRGRVWAGATDSFGYLQRSAAGEERYVDVAGEFAQKFGIEAFGDVWDVVERDDGLYFLALRHLFHVDGDGRAKRYWHHPGRFGSIGTLGERIIVQLRGTGLAELRESGPALLPGGERFAAPLVYNLIALDRERLLVHDVTPRMTLLHGEAWSPLDIAAPAGELEHLADARALPGKGDRVAFAGDDGVLRLFELASGAFTRIPVSDSFQSQVGFDRDGALWVVSEDMVTRIAWPPAWTAWSIEDGVRGAVHDLVVEGGKLHALSGAGVFTAAIADGLPKAPFVRSDWTANEAWALIGDGDSLLLAESLSVLQIDARGARVVGGDDLYPRAFLRSPSDPALIWVGTETGVALLRREGSDWQLVGTPTDLHARSLTLVETAPGELMVGSETRGLFRLRFDLVTAAAVATHRYGAAQGLDYGNGREAWVHTVDDGLLVSTRAGFFRQRGDAFVRDEHGGLAALLPADDSMRFASASDGTQWAYGFRTVFRRAPGKAWEAQQLGGIESLAIETLLPLDGGGALLGANNLVLRHAGHEAARASASAPTARVSSAHLDARGKRVALPLDGSAAVESGSGTLVFELAFSDYATARPPQFQTRLVGLGAGWSEWGDRSSVGYAALAPGAYRFEARARHQPDRVFDAQPFVFRVEPRWYQRRAVQLASALAAIAALVLLLTWRQRSRMNRLAERNTRLDTLVQERTSELETVNRRLRELAERDGLTGVANRRRFDSALAEHFAAARATGRALSLMLIDVDHFKRFNDERGHIAGDELLRQVARALTQAVRANTLVARYGGEEFALIAPGCAIDQAVLLGERLRAGAAASLGGLTVSVGVATFEPREDLAPHHLVGRADAALYLAKRRGRNRVEVSCTPGEAQPTAP